MKIDLLLNASFNYVLIIQQLTQTCVSRALIIYLSTPNRTQSNSINLTRITLKVKSSGVICIYKYMLLYAINLKATTQRISQPHLETYHHWSVPHNYIIYPVEIIT